MAVIHRETLIGEQFDSADPARPLKRPRGQSLSERIDNVAAVPNAYYHMQLSTTLSADLTQNEIGELRWHLGLGARPQHALHIADRVDVFTNDSGFRRSDPAQTVELSPLEDGRWRMTAWQELEPDELDRLEPLFCWIAARADSHATEDRDPVCLGYIRFSDEADWAHRLVVFGGRLEFPRAPARPARELLPNGDSAVTTWEDLAIRLSLTLSRLREDEWIRLATASGAGAQFCAVNSGEMLCEMVVGDILESGVPVSAADKAELERLGWRKPGRSYWGLPDANWEILLSLPVTDEQFRDAARATVSALSDVLEVAGPQLLSVSAQSAYRGEEPDTSALGLSTSS